MGILLFLLPMLALHKQGRHQEEGTLAHSARTRAKVPRTTQARRIAEAALFVLQMNRIKNFIRRLFGRPCSREADPLTGYAPLDEEAIVESRKRCNHLRKN